MSERSYNVLQLYKDAKALKQLNLREAAGVLGIHPDTLARLAREGAVRCIMPPNGGGYWFSAKVLLNYLETGSPDGRKDEKELVNEAVKHYRREQLIDEINRLKDELDEIDAEAEGVPVQAIRSRKRRRGVA